MKKLKKFVIVFLCLAAAVSEVMAQSEWTCDGKDFRFDMTVYLNPQFEGKDMKSLQGYELAAFCGDECRGVVTLETVVVEGEVRTYGYARIYGNEAEGEKITFKLHQLAGDKVWASANTVSFISQSVIGLPSEPLDVNFSNNAVVIVAKDTKAAYTGYPQTISFEVATPGLDESVVTTEIRQGDSIVAEAKDAGEYDFNFKVDVSTYKCDTSFKLTIEPASLTATACDTSKEQGADNPSAFAVSYEGFVADEDPSVLLYVPTVVCSAEKDSPVGFYVLTPKDGSAQNYVFIYKSGLMTVGDVTATDSVSVGGKLDASLVSKVSEALAENTGLTILDLRNVESIPAQASFTLANPNALIVTDKNLKFGNRENVIIGDSCPLLAITDTFAFRAPFRFKAVKATYSRVLDGAFGTICLPFAPSADSHVFYSFNEYKDEYKTFSFDIEESPKANVPYLYGMREGIMSNSIISTDVEVEPWTEAAVIKGDWTMRGTYNKEVKYENYYFFSCIDTTFYKNTGRLSIYPFRAIFECSNDKLKNVSVSFDSALTGLEALCNDMLPVDNAPRFNVYGQRVSESYRGIVIVNGKKYMIQ